MSVDRMDVLWFGDLPGADGRLEFERRRLRLVSAGVDGDQAMLARMAVFAAEPGGEDEIADTIASVYVALGDAGAALRLIAPDEVCLQRVNDALRSREVRSGALVGREAPPIHMLAEEAARFDPGEAPAPGLPLSMLHNAQDPSSRDKVLLRRAFAGTAGIELLSLSGGRSAAKVFAVHPFHRGSYHGVRMQPMFAKVDEVGKVEREFANYKDFAEPFIPFGLRPNVRELVRGEGRAVLVGDFVDRSEALWDLVRRGDASREIHNLYEETLAGWIDQGFVTPPIQDSVARRLDLVGICKPSAIDPEYAEMGGCEPGASIWKRLLALDRHHLRIAPAHGDLHGENVRIRQGQAILIDLASVCVAPTTTDIASLETALAFDVPPNTKATDYSDPVWQAEIERLYHPKTFTHAPGPGKTPLGLLWMSSVVRKLRRLGLGYQTSPGEYRAMVAALLLRRCQWMNDVPNDRFRRAVGHAVAAQLACAQEGDNR